VIEGIVTAFQDSGFIKDWVIFGYYFYFELLYVGGFVSEDILL
jgi:hypothetical protein